jgi:hypothetical protein
LLGGGDSAASAKSFSSIWQAIIARRRISGIRTGNREASRYAMPALVAGKSGHDKLRAEIVQG